MTRKTSFGASRGKGTRGRPGDSVRAAPEMTPAYPATREKPLRRIAVAFAFVVFVATAFLAWPSFSRSISPAWAETSSLSGDPWAAFPAGWTELPHPPELRPGASIVWTGTVLILWGGETPNGKASTNAGD